MARGGAGPPTPSQGHGPCRLPEGWQGGGDRAKNRPVHRHTVMIGARGVAATHWLAVLQGGDARMALLCRLSCVAHTTAAHGSGQVGELREAVGSVAGMVAYSGGVWCCEVEHVACSGFSSLLVTTWRGALVWGKMRAR